MTSAVKMAFGQVINWHLKVFKLYECWSSDNKTKSYSIRSLGITIIHYLLIFTFPIFKISSVFFVKSVNDIVNILLVSIVVIMIIIKGIIVRIKRNKIVELLEVTQDIDKDIQLIDYEKFVHPILTQSKLYFITYSCLAMSNLTLLVIHEMLASPEQRFYMSTYFYPSEFLRQPIIYISGLIYEAIGNLIVIPIFAAVDLYVVMLLYVLIAYINILSQRLQSFGYNDNDSKSQKFELVKICEMYMQISK